MLSVKVRFSMPTEWIGVEYEDEREYEFDDYMTEEEMDEEIRSDLSMWLDEILEGLRFNGEYEVLEKRRG